jgi:hypothetical protein
MRASLSKFRCGVNVMGPGLYGFRVYGPRVIWVDRSRVGGRGYMAKVYGCKLY